MIEIHIRGKSPPQKSYIIHTHYMKTPNLQIEHLVPQQIQREVTVNDAFNRVDAFMNNGAISRQHHTPPKDPDNGDVYIISQTPEDIWQDKAGWLTYYWQVWYYIQPNEGITIWVNDEDILLTYNGKEWQETLKAPATDYTQTLGVGAKADAYNKLVVRSAASLFTHAEQHNVQMKLNKAGEKYTASQLFQSNYTTHAEWGLVGSNNFSLKVSADGSYFQPVMQIDSNTAQARFYQPVQTSGIYHHFITHTPKEAQKYEIDIAKGTSHYVYLEHNIECTLKAPVVSVDIMTECTVIMKYHKSKKPVISWKDIENVQKNVFSYNNQVIEIYKFLLLSVAGESLFFSLS